MQVATYYHIYNHANGLGNLFVSKGNYRYFLQQWTKHIEPIAEAYAYCLMTNHIHFLIKLKSETDITKLFEEDALQSFGKFANYFTSVVVLSLLTVHMLSQFVSHLFLE